MWPEEYDRYRVATPPASEPQAAPEGFWPDSSQQVAHPSPGNANTIYPTPYTGPGVLMDEADYVSEAPLDGQAYVRQNGTWVATVTSQNMGITSPSGNFMWKSDATPNDPGNQRIGMDTGEVATCTRLAISNTTKNGVNASGFLAALRVDDEIVVFGKFDTSNWARFVVTGPPVAQASWYDIPVSAADSTGAEPTDWQDVLVNFTT